VPSAGQLEIELRWGRYRQAVQVPERGCTFGSTSRSDVVVPATFLSPVHARVGRDGDGWYIEAVAPEANVLVRGEDVRRSALTGNETLRLGDQIGNVVTLRVLAGAVPAVGTYAGGLRAALPGPGAELSIGCDPRCDVRLSHALVRARHATLRCDSLGALWLEDKATVAGTYVNGERLKGRRHINQGDTLQIGPYSARVGRSELQALEQVAGVDIEVDAATLYAPGTADEQDPPRRALLRDVSLHLPPATLTAVAGPSGAGKTTLMRLLSGQVNADKGQVRYNGDDLAAFRHAHAPLMGFVPQDDIVHGDLNVHEALDYQARLRLPIDTAPGEREERIGQALRFVGLVAQSRQLVRTLSGGQRKRVSIASELLNDPEVLFLDEPTSGLDPGLDKRMMLLLRLLADQGRTVILTTHAITHVDVCDELVLVGPGGRIIYAAPPSEVTSWFGVETLGDVFSLVETPETSAEAAARVPASPGSSLVPRPPAAASRGQTAGVRLQFWSPAWRQVVRRQGTIFAERYVRLFSRDRSAMLFSLCQGVALALLAALVAPPSLQWGFEGRGGATTMFVVGCAVVWFGMINSVRELVKEKAIWQREQLVGAIVPAYLASKVVVLGVLAAFQTLTVLICLSLTVGLPSHGPVGAPFITMGITLWLANMSGIAIGLLVSALAPNSDRAMSIVPYLLIPQLVLSGVLFTLGDLGVLSFLISSRWSVSGLGGIAGDNAAALNETSGLYPGSLGGLMVDWMMLAVLAVVGVTLCARVLRRQARVRGLG
jgi:ABC-type multidrug transport system ATPase subunit/pSer/pThr/pTyr-binding forkhead associated (FHA) protein/ABC-type multidrug transport system permease subunit